MSALRAHGDIHLPVRITLELLDLDRRTIDVTGPITIGREPPCDVVLDDGSVSKEHARIEPHDLGFVIIDLDTTNGTSTGGVPLVPHVPRLLLDGSLMTIGKLRANVRVRPEIAHANDDPSTKELALRMLRNAGDLARDHATLVVVEGAEMGTRLTLRESGRVWTVGRDRASDLALSDGALSLKHIAVREEEGVIELRDLGSRHGTLLLMRNLGTNAWTKWPARACVAIGNIVIGLETPRPSASINSAAPPLPPPAKEPERQEPQALPALVEAGSPEAAVPERPDRSGAKAEAPMVAAPVVVEARGKRSRSVLEVAIFGAALMFLLMLLGFLAWVLTS